MITFTYSFIVILIVEKKKGSLLTSVNLLMTSLTDLNGIRLTNSRPWHGKELLT